MANTHRGRGCLNSVAGRRWTDYPYYTGVCPDIEPDCDDNDARDCRRRRRRGRFGMFTASLPVAVAANGIIPLAAANCLGRHGDFPANSGLITLEEPGTYLAAYDLRLPEGAALDSTVTLNVNEACQTAATTLVGGEGPASFSAQAIFEVCDRATVTLRSSAAISMTEPSVQPLATLTLIRLD